MMIMINMQLNTQNIHFLKILDIFTKEFINFTSIVRFSVRNHKEKICVKVNLKWYSPFLDNNFQVQELMYHRLVVVEQPSYTQVGDVWMHQHELLRMFQALEGLRQRVEIHELVQPYCTQATRHQLFPIRGTRLALQLSKIINHYSRW